MKFAYIFISLYIINLNCFAITKSYQNTIDSPSLPIINSSLKKEYAEQQLIEVIDLIQSQKIDHAIKKNKLLIKKYPNFKLLNAIQTDLLFSQNNSLTDPFASIQNKDQQQQYLSEANARLYSVTDSTDFYQQNIPDKLKYIDKSTPYFFIIDFSKSRLYLFDNTLSESPQLISDHYVTSGKNGYNKEKKGDKKTPSGVYHITSFLEDEQLPELYGWGAFPINYPNAWDKTKKRTGSGIWLHGVPRNTYSRPPLDSKGCLVISNNFLINIAKYLKINTPVILSPSINWIPRKSYTEQSKLYQTVIKQWKTAWVTKNLKKYLSFYSKSFSNNKKNFHSWSKHKRRIFNRTKSIKIKINQLNIFEYPGEKEMLAVSFYQSYQGDNYKSNAYKLQYWKKEKDGVWRIIYEYSYD